MTGAVAVAWCDDRLGGHVSRHSSTAPPGVFSAEMIARSVMLTSTPVAISLDRQVGASRTRRRSHRPGRPACTRSTATSQPAALDRLVQRPGVEHLGDRHLGIVSRGRQLAVGGGRHAAQRPDLDGPGQRRAADVDDRPVGNDLVGEHAAPGAPSPSRTGPPPHSPQYSQPPPRPGTARTSTSARPRWRQLFAHAVRQVDQGHRHQRRRDRLQDGHSGQSLMWPGRRRGPPPSRGSGRG